MANNPYDHVGREIVEVLGLKGIESSRTVLDIGCGAQNLKKLLPAKVTGIDLDVKDPKSPPDLICSATNLPFADNSFDIAVSHWGGLAHPLTDLGVYIDKPK